MNTRFRMLMLAAAAPALLLVGAPDARADAIPIAYYAAENNADDSAGSHDGSLISSAGFGTGIAGQAFSLNGSSQYVSVPDSSAWAFGSGDFTLALYANFDTIKTGSLGALPNVFVGQSNGPGPTNKWVFFYDGNGNLGFHINGPSSAFLTPGTTIAPAAGDWHHYAVTRSGSTYTFYFDGTSVGTASSSISIPDSTAALTIGQAEGLGYFDGLLDELRIYDSALSASEIAALATPVPEPGTLALIGLGAAGLAWRRRRQRAAA